MSQTATTNGAATPAKVDPTKTLARDKRAFAEFLKSRMPSIQAAAASHMNPKRLFNIVLANVTRTPALQDCTLESIFRATLQAAELGLEPGSAVGEAYLVPFGKDCTLIPGYRGLITLAFRSGHVRSVAAHVVYQSDKFEFELGLEPKLRHVPSWDGARDPKNITFAYCIVHLKDGGVLYDVMTRGEVDAIRKRSRAGNSGPWVTDYAEMARKTITRRCLKYAPMSVEMSKALAADLAAEQGEGIIDAEFESLDFAEVEPAPSKASRVADKIGAVPVDAETGEVYDGPTVHQDGEELGI